MSDPAISRFPVPDLADLPEDLRERILAVQEKAGFVPNVFLVLAHRPAECRAFLAWHDALMEKESGLSKAERELVVVATSTVNHCLYCVVAHGALLRIQSKRPLLADQVATNWRKAELNDRERVIVEFAMQMAERSHTVEDADFERLRAAGLDQEEIWDIGAITALFAASNRMANLTAMRPNAEFHLLGRVPRQR